MTAKPGFRHLGQRRKIIDGLEKITGRAEYAADVNLPGMLHIRPVLSLYAKARILSVNSSAALKLPGVVAVFTAEDLPVPVVANSRSSAILASGETVFAGQPVAVVVAETEQAAQDGANLVEIEYEALPAAVDVLSALESDAPVVWPEGLPDDEVNLAAAHGGTDDSGRNAQAGSNLNNQKTWSRGDAQAGFAAAHVTVTHTYHNAWVHQTYLEPHAAVVQPGRKPGELTVYTSTQDQLGVRSEVARIHGLRERDVRVVAMVVGGGFGAKYGTIEPLVAAVALKLNRPAKLVFSRSEDFQATTPSPGTVIELKTGADAEGRLTALEARITIDMGAYPFGFAGVLAMSMGGWYKCPNMHIEVREVFTNKTATGAYRAPGVPQVSFALESNMDDLARALNLDPIEFRLRNAVEQGDPNGMNRPWAEGSLKACLERLQEHPAWRNRTHRPGEGVGIAVGGWPGAFSPAGAVCRIEPDGTARLHLGTVDISGVNSSLVLIVAEELGIEPEMVEVVQGDTDSGPYSPGSGGSQVTVSVSGAVQSAASNARKQLLEIASSEFEAHVDDLELVAGAVRVKGVPERSIGIGQLAERAQSKAGGPGPIVAEGRASMKSGAPGFIAQLVRVRVDELTGAVTPLEVVAVQDVGFAMNPMLVEGQIHGGNVQALGYGLFEAMHFDESGGLASSNFMGYAFPRSTDVPALEAILLENPSKNGPFGARVVGEPPITAAGAAAVNAIKDAVGVRVTEMPVTPEALWRLMNARD